MANKILFFFLFIVAAPSAYADFSLFFKSQETSSPDVQISITPETLSLGAIIYTDATHWTLWVNGKIIHPETVHTLEKFSIERVTPEDVTFSFSTSEGSIFGWRTMSLRMSTPSSVFLARSLTSVRDLRKRQRSGSISVEPTQRRKSPSSWRRSSSERQVLARLAM